MDLSMITDNKKRLVSLKNTSDTYERESDEFLGQINFDRDTIVDSN